MLPQGARPTERPREQTRHAEQDRAEPDDRHAMLPARRPGGSAPSSGPPTPVAAFVADGDRARRGAGTRAGADAAGTRSRPARRRRSETAKATIAIV